MNNVKQLRQEKGWTQGELGKKLGVSKQAIHFWETHGFNEKTAKKLAEALGVKPEELGVKHNRDLSRQIQAAIVKSNLTEKQFAKAIGTRTPYLKKWLKEGMKPSMKFVEAISNLIGITPEEFYKMA